MRLKRDELHAVWRAELAALGMSGALPMAVDEAVAALIEPVRLDRTGLLDVTLVLLLCRISTQQAAGLRFDQVQPGTVRVGQETLDAVAFDVLNPIGILQRAEPRVVVTGPEATLIKRWGALREDEIHSDHAPFLARRSPRGTMRPVNPRWMAQRMRHLATQAGIVDAHEPGFFTPRNLRTRFEREALRVAAVGKISAQARLTPHSALRLIERMPSDCHSVKAT